MRANSWTLRRSTENTVLAGVMGGLGEFFGLDPTRLRWVYVLFSLISAGFPGILVYLALWIVIPRR